MEKDTAMEIAEAILGEFGGIGEFEPEAFAEVVRPLLPKVRRPICDYCLAHIETCPKCGEKE